jgi:hypothetical protein
LDQIVLNAFTNPKEKRRHNAVPAVDAQPAQEKI